MTTKKTKFFLSWPNKMLKISGRLRNIAILLTERTILPYSNLILPPSLLFYRMWRHFLLDDPDTTRITSWILPGPLLPWQPTFRLACIRVVYITKFVARYESLFYHIFFWEKNCNSGRLVPIAHGARVFKNFRRSIINITLFLPYL